MLFHHHKDTAQVRVRIDEGCISCMSCTKACPSFFRYTAESLNGRRVITVKKELLQDLRKAENICPRGIITITEEN